FLSVCDKLTVFSYRSDRRYSYAYNVWHEQELETLTLLPWLLLKYATKHRMFDMSDGWNPCVCNLDYCLPATN
ncbi:MAG: hypothetical protein NZ821_09650, partial [Gloeomargarita sp. SKYB31]|nr:hypothetical protein [Gloeomargarita sp. SKYB31]